MNQLIIHNHLQNNITVVSNQFIDEYMVRSNGEFVKIYIYLLRCMGTSHMPVSICAMADTFGHTENDILRALKHWEKEQLLKLEFAADQTVRSITLLPISGISEPAPPYDQETAASAEKQKPATDTAMPETAPEPAAVPAPDPAPAPEKKIRISRDRIKKLKEEDDIIQLLFIAEQYLGKSLSSTEINTILYFYDELNMNADLIEYLIEYCVSKEKKHIRYIQSVGLAWHEQGIKTSVEAKENAAPMDKKYFTVLKAFGLNNRWPAQSEITLIDTWTAEYGFEMDIILEACKRTIDQTHQPNFKYADRILFDWKKNNVRHLKDITRLDIRHQESKSKKAEKPRQSSDNKFNNFHQRTYDYDKLEQQLLNK